MGFMTGPQYQCQECGEISPFVIEFENEEDYKAFLAEEEWYYFRQLQHVKRIGVEYGKGWVPCIITDFIIFKCINGWLFC